MIDKNDKICSICNYEYPQQNRLYQIVAIILVVIFILSYVF